MRKKFVKLEIDVDAHLGGGGTYFQVVWDLQQISVQLQQWNSGTRIDAGAGAGYFTYTHPFTSAVCTPTVGYLSWPVINIQRLSLPLLRKCGEITNFRYC